MAIRTFAFSVLALTFGALSATACDEAVVSLPQEGSPTATAALAMVNYPAVTATSLRLLAGVDAVDAANIVAYRDGADGLPVTDDDRHFDSVIELAAVTSPEAVHMLGDYALATGWPSQSARLGTWDDVAFTVFEAEVVLDLVNDASYFELDETAGLNKAVVDGIMARRPLHSIERLADIPRMGTVNMAKLKDYAMSQPGLGLHGGTL